MAGEKAFSGDLPTVGRQRSARQITVALNELLGFVNQTFSESATAGNANEFLKTDGAGNLSWDKAIRTSANLINDSGAGLAGQVLRNDGDNTLSWKYGMFADVELTHSGGAGTAGQVLQSDGDGTTSWTATTPLTDGDKGDVTVSGGGLTWTIENDTITYSKIQNMSANKMLGRETTGAGDIEEITLQETSGHFAYTNSKLDLKSSKTMKVVVSHDGLASGSQNIVENTTTETSLLDGTNIDRIEADGSNGVFIPANTIVDGTTYRIKGIGRLECTGTPTIRLRFYGLNTGTLGTTKAIGPVTIPTSGMSGLFEFESVISFDTSGGYGSVSIIMNSYMRVINDSTGETHTFSNSNTTPVTGIDMSASTSSIQPYFTWGTASASNSLFITTLTVEKVI